jgi:hypothetical protein
MAFLLAFLTASVLLVRVLESDAAVPVREDAVLVMVAVLEAGTDQGYSTCAKYMAGISGAQER